MNYGSDSVYGRSNRPDESFEARKCPVLEDPLCIVIATRNSGKIAEIKDLLAGHPVQIKSLDDFGPIPEVAEDGDTFEENAYKRPASRLGSWGFPPLPTIRGWSSMLLADGRGFFRHDTPDKRQPMPSGVKNCWQRWTPKAIDARRSNASSRWR